MDDRELAQAIAQAESSSPPGEIEQSMRQNRRRNQLRPDRSSQRADAAAAAERLEALAHDLESARRAAAGPELERLLAAEKEAAALQERLRTVRQSSQQAAAERAFEDLAGRLDRLAPREGTLRQAAENMAGATRTGHAGWARADTGQGRRRKRISSRRPFIPQTLAAAVAALQARIQEMSSKTPWSSATGRCRRSTRTWSTIITGCFPRTCGDAKTRGTKDRARPCARRDPSQSGSGDGLVTSS